MLFVMDVGNSHTVFGMYDGDRLGAHWRVATGHYRTADELRMLLTVLFQQEGVSRRDVRGCCISSVVPQLDGALHKVSCDTFGFPPLMVGPGIRTGLVLQCENPKEVGADRIVNSVGAIETYGGPLAVVDFGTATTFDAVTAKAEWLGGLIVPGLELSAEALAQHCAKLPHVEIATPPTVIGRNTVANIRSGLTYGYADLVDGILVRIADEMGAPIKVVATGGFAETIADVATRIDHVDPFLTLKGLKIVYEKNERAPA